jgi:hypothetical protein
MSWRMSLYRDEGWNRSGLSLYFGEDFCNWKSAMFKKASADAIRRLRNFLRRRGVYVSKGPDTHMADALAAAIKEELAWPSDEDEKPEPRRKRSTTNVNTSTPTQIQTQ